MSMDYKSSDNHEHYRVDDLAFISYGAYEKFSYMAEFEFKEFYTVEKENSITTHEINNKLYTERVYLEYQYNQNTTLKVGKYNSPIGYWNLLPVNVLRETTSSPITSSIIFPKFTTGVNISYNSFENIAMKFDIMLQNNNGISDQYNNYHIDKHYGFGTTYEDGDYAIKLNVGNFNNKLDINGDSLYYALISAKYENDFYQIKSEIGKQTNKHESTVEYAGYIQGTYFLDEQNTAILRVESYKDNITNTDDDIAIVGYTYRPLYPIALKAEYQLHSKDSSNELLVSFSVMF